MRRDVPQLSTIPVVGTDQEDLIAPFFSPDGTSVGLISTRTRTMKKVPIGGGTPTTMVDGLLDVPRAPSWLSDGTIVFGQTNGLWRAAGDPSKPVQLAKTDSASG